MAVGAVLAAWALALSLSRRYLGVRWVDDVLGSWLPAGVFLAALVAAGHRVVAAA